MKRFIALMAIVVCSLGTTAFTTTLPSVVIGPGLNSGRTDYHQNFDRHLSADTLYTLTGIYFVDSTYTLSIEPGTVMP